MDQLTMCCDHLSRKQQTDKVSNNLVDKVENLDDWEPDISQMESNTELKVKGRVSDTGNC